MLEVQHLCPEQPGIAVVQDQFIHDSQGCREVGNLTTDPPDSYHRKTCHPYTIWEC